MRRWTISEINSLSRDEFVRIAGPVFELSPWIAELAWRQKPFMNLEHLYRAMCETVEIAGVKKQLALIRVHPDLAGRLALAGKLTAESANEQSSAGLDRLSLDEIGRLQRNNMAYKKRFDFPFIICARLNQKESILAAFERRLQNPREQEIKTALEEILKIAKLRLQDVVAQ
ncbi:MAG: 2-oxo-4-hydroxy-4-carboxy-5-ureidoimidazoline decarboxylase [Verrucomicrobiota bacterium]|jgi:2-oxo-4-hydroxy-4-carboxy-5-ureidoimidazoline decarboxylase